MSVISDTTVTPEDFVYQPYVGGIPAPNPDYPQPIQVVTGEQTVTISDGVDSEDFTISLGSTEFCKIGDYQDYIYKSGDDWYAHKAIGKIILDGSENWQGNWQNANTPDYWQTYLKSADFTTNYLESTNGANTKCSHFTCHGVTVFPRNEVCYALNNSATYSLQFKMSTSFINTVANWQTWLSTHNTTVYYALATPTDAKITDATLVGQLNAVHEWLTRYGYDATVSGNLPLIVDRTNP